jgi:uncharacterized protein
MIFLDYAVIGVLAGFLAGYLGIGGGLVIVPALAWLFAMNAEHAEHAVHMAVATSLASMLPTAFSSIWAHHRRRAVAWGTVRLLAPGLAGGAAGGAILASMLSTGALASMFGIYAVVAGLQLLAGKQAKGERPMPGPLAGTATGMAIGGISSMVGIGGGSMTVPWLLWHGRPAGAAVATAAACGYPIAISATLAYILLGSPGTDEITGFVHLPALAGIAIFSMATAPLGAAAVHRSEPTTVRRVFGGFLLLVAWRMFL